MFRVLGIYNFGLLSALLNWFKLVYGPFALSNMHCGSPARKESNVLKLGNVLLFHLFTVYTLLLLLFCVFCAYYIQYVHLMLLMSNGSM